jgi:hypothetical protein
MRTQWLLALAVSAVGCGVLSPEEQLLTRFFEAARLHDTTVMAKYATVTFNPRTEGVVQTFEVDEVERVADRLKVVTLRAHVRGPDGRMAARALRATMREQPDGWMITELREP